MDMTGKAHTRHRQHDRDWQGAAEMFRSAGARVAINGRDPSNVDRAIAEMGGKGYVAAPGHVARLRIAAA